MGAPGNPPSSFCRGHFYALAKMMLTDTTMMSTKNVPTSSRGVAGSGCEFAGGLMCVGVTGASTETCTVTLVFQLVTAGVLGGVCRSLWDGLVSVQVFTDDIVACCVLSVGCGCLGDTLAG